MANEQRIALTTAETIADIQQQDIDAGVKQELITVVEGLEGAASQAADTIASCARDVQTRQEEVQQLRERILSLPAVNVVDQILSSDNLFRRVPGYTLLDPDAEAGDVVVIQSTALDSAEQFGGTYTPGANDNYVLQPDESTIILNPQSINWQDSGGGYSIRNAYMWAKSVQKIAFGMQHETNSDYFATPNAATSREQLNASTYGVRKRTAINAMLRFFVGELLTVYYAFDELAQNNDYADASDAANNLDVWYESGGNLLDPNEPGSRTPAELREDVSTIIEALLGSYDPVEAAASDAQNQTARQRGLGDGDASTADYRYVVYLLNQFILATNQADYQNNFVSSRDGTEFNVNQSLQQGVTYITDEAWSAASTDTGGMVTFEMFEDAASGISDWDLAREAAAVEPTSATSANYQMVEAMTRGTSNQSLEGEPGYREGDWETQLATYQIFINNYTDAFNIANTEVTGPPAADPAFQNPADGVITWWTDQNMREWASADGAAIDSLIAGTRRTLLDARQMLLGTEAISKVIWPQWAAVRDGNEYGRTQAESGRFVVDPARVVGPIVSETNPDLRHLNGDYLELREEAPMSYGVDFNSGDAAQTVEIVPESNWMGIAPAGGYTPPSTRTNATLAGGVEPLLWQRSIRIKLPTDFASDPFGGWASTDSWVDSLNNEDLSYTGEDDAISFELGSGRLGFGMHGWIDNNVWSRALVSTWSAENQALIEAFQDSLKNWMRALLCITEAANAFNTALDNASQRLQELGQENPPDDAWWHGIVPDWINAPNDQQNNTYRAIQDLRRRVRSEFTLAGLLDTNAERLLFKEQCFLLSYIVPITEFKKNYLEGYVSAGMVEAYSLAGGDLQNLRGNIKPKKIPYLLDPNEGNACQIIDGEGYGFMNRLVVTPGANKIDDIPHSELSNLVPMIRLFKIYSDRDDGQLSQLEFQFESNFGSLKAANRSFEPATVLGDRLRRGAGVGIKNFSFTYDGSNPFAIKKSIKATLEIFANTFDELMEQRQTLTQSMAGKSYRYVDLALKTGDSDDTPSNADCDGVNASQYRTQEQNNNLSRLNFRLKAVVGWARPSHLAQRQEDQDLLNSIYNSYVTLDLTPTVHEFSFDEMGRVTLKIDYLAYIEDFYDQSSFNIFANSFENNSNSLTLKSIKRELELDYFTKTCDSTEMNNIRKSYAEEVNNEKRLAVQNLITALMEKELLYYINLDYEEVGRFLRMGPFATGLAQNGYRGADREPGTGDDFVRSITQNQTIIIDQINEALSGVSEAFTAAAAQDSGQSVDELTNAWKAAVFAGSNPQTQVLSYFYASDLIDVILENIETEIQGLPNAISQLQPPGDEEAALFRCKRFTKIHATRQMADSFRKLRILLGPLEIVNQGDIEEVYQANLGDVPISTKYFIEWLTDKLLTNKETVYPLTSFLNDFFNEIVRSFLNNDLCFNWNISQNVRVQQAAVSSYGGNPRTNEDPVVHGASSGMSFYTGSGRYSINDFNASLPILKLSPSSEDPNSPLPLSQLPVDEQFQYLVYFCGRVNPTNLMTGNKQEDQTRGIPHFLLGAQRGLVKNIELQKTQTPGLAEVRFEQENYDGLRQLRVVYDAYITTYSNVKVYPGTYIYIDPAGFSPSSNRYAAGSVYDLTQYGVGGYYMVIKSENNLGPGLSETKITAKWVHQIESQGEQNENSLRPSSTGRNAVSKCSTERRNYQAPTDEEATGTGG